MSSAAWHVVPTDLDHYLAGTSDLGLAASIEAHLVVCSSCRSALAAARTASADADRRWELVATAVDRPRYALWSHLGVATPELRVAWLAAALLAFALPIMLASMRGVADALPLLALAPLVPLLATALAFRTTADPAGELALALPQAGLTRVARRSVVVGLSVLPPGLATALLLELPPREAMAWLLPGVALSALVLAAGGTRVDPAHVAIALAAVWATGVSAGAALGPASADTVIAIIAGVPLQVTSLLIGILGMSVVLARRDEVLRGGFL